MIGYQQTYRPAYAMAQGTAAPVVSPSGAMLPPPPAPSLTSTQRDLAIALGVAQTMFGGLATWMGVRAGLNDRGIFSVLGWVVGGGGALFTMINLLGTIGMVETKV